MTSNIVEDEVKNKVLDLKQVVSGQVSGQELHFPIMIKVMTEQETKEYHLKKLAEWGERWKEEQAELVFAVDRNIYRNQELLGEQTSEEEKQWVIHKMKAPQRSWERWFVGQYFTEEQKKKLGLTQKDIAGKGMR